jgi:hypothetical protein
LPHRPVRPVVLPDDLVRAVLEGALHQWLTGQEGGDAAYQRCLYGLSVDEQAMGTGP